jgi:hypothetical protein
MKFCPHFVCFPYDVENVHHTDVQIKKVITSFLKIEAMKIILCLGALKNFFLTCCPVRMKFGISFISLIPSPQLATTNRYSHIDI